MRTSLRFILVCCAGIACQPKTASVDLAAEEAAVKAASDGFSKAETSGRPDSALAFMWDDAVLQPPNGPQVIGHDAIRAFYAPVGLGEVPADSAPPASSRTLQMSASGDMAVEWGPGAIVVEPPGVPPFMARFKFISVWVKKNGVWKLRFNGWNSLDPEPSAAPAKPK